ncbi:hypothetical protein HMPREF1981_01961 [Bacteroides pyogenes F0041]|uniref:Uncharacterized protein n=1 Tax=Bacteroides pyogenes F0041 TaxID=1321819 RepID=U2CKJ6_9BACE|nr:hypothetical protein HMPREF1981_01961 [Bacteroides pyogenes F0041]
MFSEKLTSSFNSSSDKSLFHSFIGILNPCSRFYIQVCRVCSPLVIFPRLYRLEYSKERKLNGKEDFCFLLTND